jgi:O-acetylhomoserine/O-acetylserine sulfhydrylase-like pyridoxal-dependent enzyme
MMSSNKWHTLTKIIKAGEGKDFSDVRIPGIPIYQTTNFLYPDVELGTEILLGQKPGHIYSRYTNPTVDTLNEIMAVLENAESARPSPRNMVISCCTVIVNPRSYRILIDNLRRLYFFRTSYRDST